MTDEFNKKIKFTLVYNGLEVNLSLNKDINLNVLYSEAYNAFSPKRRYKLSYKNKDLTPFLDYPIGVLFKNLTHVNILIKESDILVKNNTLNKSHSLNYIRYIKNKKFPNFDNRMICFECRQNLINCFCRKCGIFICSDCKSSKENKHLGHRTVILYLEDLKKSAMLYKNLIYVNLEDTKNSHKHNIPLNIDNCEVDVEYLNKKLIEKFHNFLSKISNIKNKLINIDYYNEEKELSINDINNNIKLIQNVNIEDQDNNLGQKFRELNQFDKNISRYHGLSEKINTFEKVGEKLNNYLERLDNIMNEEMINAYS